MRRRRWPCVFALAALAIVAGAQAPYPRLEPQLGLPAQTEVRHWLEYATAQVPLEWKALAAASPASSRSVAIANRAPIGSQP